MSRHIPTIDLTQSELNIICNDNINNNIVIEINDSSGSLGHTPRPSPRRRRRQVNYVCDDSVQIIESPRTEATTVRNRKKTRTSKKKEEITAIKNDDDSKIRDRSPLTRTIDCPICLEPFTTQPLLTTKCGHIFCKDCLLQAVSRDKKCPTCRTSLRNKSAYHALYLTR